MVVAPTIFSRCEATVIPQADFSQMPRLPMKKSLQHCGLLRIRFLRCYVTVFALACAAFCPDDSAAAGSLDGEQRPTRFVERPGVLEFSGQMIVRPLQAAALRELGLDPRQIDATSERARTRLADFVLEQVHETDEYIVRLPAGETENSYAARLMATGDYQYVVPNWRCFPTETIPNDGSYGMQWHHPKVQSPLAWDFTTGDPGVIIAIVDGGVWVDHPDLAGAVVPGYNADDRVSQQDGGDVDDVDGHGTYVAGLAGAIGNNGVHVVGMGWRFSVMPVRYYNNPGGGFLDDILDGARWAVDHGARIVNVSQTGVEWEPVQTTGEYVKSQGGLLFWAAGNDARDLSWFDWSDVIVVGASDSIDERADFSAYGVAIDVFAPGTDIVSTAWDGGLAIGSGTSAASPIAAGIAALILAVAPALSPEQVEQILFGGCVDLGEPGDDETFGRGRVDSYLSVKAADRIPIPAASQWGVVTLCLLILTVGTVRIRKVIRTAGF